MIHGGMGKDQSAPGAAVALAGARLELTRVLLGLLEKLDRWKGPRRLESPRPVMVPSENLLQADQSVVDRSRSMSRYQASGRSQIVNCWRPPLS